MANVHMAEVRKTYPNGFKAIHGISIEITDGELIVIVGPSGCGKSTLLRMVAGLETVTDGDIQIGERVVNDLEPADRDIAMVFQNYALYPHMKVYDNMAYGLRNRRIPRGEIDRRVRGAARILELEDLLDRRPRQLSGGQRQRVAMGRAIVREPAVFLFDEPLSNLDAKLRVQMRLEIKRLQRRLGVTSLYVTHDQIEAMTMADRLIVMNGGVVEQVGSPLDVYERPATVFVAGFIGSPSMNFLDATVKGGRIEVTGRQTVTAPPTASEGPVVLGLRPEQLDNAPDAGELSLDIDVVEPLGTDALVHGRLTGSEQDFTVRMPQSTTSALKGRCKLPVSMAHMHLFDPTTGRRIAEV